MAERDDYVYRAKLAEQAERYDGIIFYYDGLSYFLNYFIFFVISNLLKIP